MKTLHQITSWCCTIKRGYWNLAFVWMQRHQQHMHTLLLQDSGSLLTWRLVLIQLHWEVPEVAVQGNQCLAFLLSKWKKKKACSSVEQVIWWSFTFSWDVLVKFLNWDIGIQLENWFHCFFQQPSENQEHCRWEFFDWTKFWRLLFLLSFWHRQEREVFVAHELHLCILYTFFEANMLLTGSDGVFFHTSWDCILLLVLRVLRAFTGLFLGSDKSHKLIRPEWSLKQFAGCYTSVVKQVGNDCCNKPQP